MGTGSKCTMEHRTLVYPRGLFNPEDWLSFVQLEPFQRGWKQLGLSDDDLRQLEVFLMADPLLGRVIPGTGGVRKMRCVPGGWNAGKRGALRVCYAYLSEVSIVILVVAYGKNRKDNLSGKEKAAMRKLIPAIVAGFSRERKTVKRE